MGSALGPVVSMIGASSVSPAPWWVSFHDFNPIWAKATFPNQHDGFATSSPPLLHVIKDGFLFFSFVLFSHKLCSSFLLPTLIHLVCSFFFLPIFFSVPLSSPFLFFYPSLLS